MEQKNELAEMLGNDTDVMVEQDALCGYAVFLSLEGRLVVRPLAAGDRMPSNLYAGYLETKAQVDRLQAIALNSLSDNDNKKLVHLLASALMQSIRGDQAGALALLAEAKKLTTWSLPEVDWAELIHEDRKRGFLVCLDARFKTYWETTHEYDSVGYKSPTDHNATLRGVAELETKPDEFLSTGNKKAFGRLLGEAIACSLQHDYDNAAKLLDEARHFFKSRHNEASRLWFMHGAVGTCLICLLAVGLIDNYRNDYTQFWITSDSPGFFSIALVGMLGALFFSSIRLGKTSFDFGSEQSLYYFEGFLKMLFGGVAALLMVAAVKSGLIVPSIVGGAKIEKALIIFSFVAGFSERWLPSLATQLVEEKMSSSSARPVAPTVARDGGEQRSN